MGSDTLIASSILSRDHGTDTVHDAFVIPHCFTPQGIFVVRVKVFLPEGVFCSHNLFDTDLMAAV